MKRDKKQAAVTAPAPLPPMKQKRPEQMSNDEIIQRGKMLRLEASMKAMKNSQDLMEQSTSDCQKQITDMKKSTADSIAKQKA